MRKKKLGIVFGGGGARTFAHLGVLLELAEAGIKPEVVTGSSMGSLLAALYACENNAKSCTDKALAYFLASPSFAARKTQERGDGLHRRPGFTGIMLKKIATAMVATTVSFRRGLRKKHPVYKAIDQLFPENILIEKLNMPFSTVAMDLSSGKLAIFSKGQLAPALKAGVAVGLVFSPFHWQGKDYADAAPVCPVPVSENRKLGADIVLALDVCAPVEEAGKLDNGFEVVRRIVAVSSDLLLKQELAQADMVIKPEVKDIFWADFSQLPELIKRGRQAARDNLPALQRLLS